MLTITDEMESFINAQRNESEEELKQQHLFAKLELDLMKREVIQNRKKEMELHEELKRSKEDVKQLWQLVQEANNERSMLLQLLQMAFNLPAEVNSSITQTDNSSVGPSIVDSSFEALYYPPGSSNTNQIVSGEVGFCTASSSSPALLPSGTLEIDPFDAEIDHRVRLRSLPQKGKLLEAVKKSSARLQEAKLLMSQPIPNFRNSPRLQSMKFALLAGKHFGTTGIRKEPVSVEQHSQAMFFDG